MDLLGEASSSGGRILTARHIPTDRLPPPPLADEAVNATILCTSSALPDVKTYMNAINVYGVIVLALGGAALLALYALYCDTLRTVLRGHRANVKTCSAWVLAVYPVVGTAAYCGMIVPRAQLLSEAITQGMFMVSMYQLFCLIVAYCGGEAEFIRRVKPIPLETRVAPCCCYPCCRGLPRPPLTKRTLLYLRLLVLQLPVVQGALYAALLFMWADEQSSYEVNSKYAQPAVVASILCGVWGVVVTCRAAEGAASGARLRSKFLALQLVLLATKLQGGAARALPTHLLPCTAPVTPPLYLNLIYNSLVLFEMVLLSVWAHHLYRAAPDADGSADPPRVQHVKVVEDLARPGKLIDEAPKFGVVKEGLFNKSFDSDKN